MLRPTSCLHVSIRHKLVVSLNPLLVDLLVHVLDLLDEKLLSG